MRSRIFGKASFDTSKPKVSEYFGNQSWSIVGISAVLGIELVGSESDEAERGNLRMISPWDLAQERLTVVTYTYDV